MISGGIRLRRRPNERMEMFRHENVPDDLEFQLKPQLAQRPNPSVPKTLRVKQTCASVGAGGHIMQMVETVIMLEPWHPNIIGVHGSHTSRQKPSRRMRPRGPFL